MSKIIPPARLGQPGRDRRRCVSRAFLTVPALVLALVVGILVDTTELAAQKVSAVPGYVLQTLAIPDGFTKASVRSINDNHEMVGTTLPSSMGQRAIYWASADAAPVLLPCPTPPCTASSINASAVISGTANFQAVHWRFNGTEWLVEPLPYPGIGDPAWRSYAGGLLDDGTTAGAYQYYYGVRFPNDIPVRFTSGTWFEYPVPPGFFAGRAYRVNESEDAVGELKQNDGQDPTYVYGVIWIAQEGGGYRTVQLNNLVNGITPRFADGSFLVSSPSGRMRVSPSGAYVFEASPDGAGLGINRLGDMVGVLNKKGGIPFLFTRDGTLITLPLLSGTTGGAGCVSTDRWAAGDYQKLHTTYPAVWKPR